MAAAAAAPRSTKGSQAGARTGETKVLLFEQAPSVPASIATAAVPVVVETAGVGEKHKGRSRDLFQPAHPDEFCCVWKKCLHCLAVSATSLTEELMQQLDATVTAGLEQLAARLNQKIPNFQDRCHELLDHPSVKAVWLEAPHKRDALVFGVWLDRFQILAAPSFCTCGSAQETIAAATATPSTIAIAASHLSPGVEEFQGKELRHSVKSRCEVLREALTKKRDILEKKTKQQRDMEAQTLQLLDLVVERHRAVVRKVARLSSVLQQPDNRRSSSSSSNSNREERAKQPAASERSRAQKGVAEIMKKKEKLVSDFVSRHEEEDPSPFEDWQSLKKKPQQKNSVGCDCAGGALSEDDDEEEEEEKKKQQQKRKKKNDSAEQDADKKSAESWDKNVGKDVLLRNQARKKASRKEASMLSIAASRERRRRAICEVIGDVQRRCRRLAALAACLTDHSLNSSDYYSATLFGPLQPQDPSSSTAADSPFFKSTSAACVAAKQHQKQQQQQQQGLQTAETGSCGLSQRRRRQNSTAGVNSAELIKTFQAAALNSQRSAVNTPLLHREAPAGPMERSEKLKSQESAVLTVSGKKKRSFETRGKPHLHATSSEQYQQQRRRLTRRVPEFAAGVNRTEQNLNATAAPASSTPKKRVGGGFLLHLQREETDLEMVSAAADVEKQKKQPLSSDEEAAKEEEEEQEEEEERSFFWSRGNNSVAAVRGSIDSPLWDLPLQQQQLRFSQHHHRNRSGRVSSDDAAEAECGGVEFDSMQKRKQLLQPGPSLRSFGYNSGEEEAATGRSPVVAAEQMLDNNRSSRSNSSREQGGQLCDRRSLHQFSSSENHVDSSRKRRVLWSKAQQLPGIQQQRQQVGQDCRRGVWQKDSSESLDEEDIGLVEGKDIQRKNSYSGVAKGAEETDEFQSVSSDEITPHDTPNRPETEHYGDKDLSTKQFTT